MLNKLQRTSQIIWLIVIPSLLAGGLIWLHDNSQRQHVVLAVKPALSVPGGQDNSYTTSFVAAEEPISEGGKWISGNAIGRDWTDVITGIGLAYGTESGKGKGNQAFDDSTALLAGTWRPDQTVEAEVHSINQNDHDFEEVELRLRSSLSSHNATGYEVLFRCSKTASAYASIVRWDGRLGIFTYIGQEKGAEFGVADGDVVKATALGNVITGYINDIPVIRATDKTYAGGSPGMGFWFKRSSSKRFWLQKSAGVNTDCGFRRLAAWD